MQSESSSQPRSDLYQKLYHYYKSNNLSPEEFRRRVSDALMTRDKQSDQAAKDKTQDVKSEDGTKAADTDADAAVRDRKTRRNQKKYEKKKKKIQQSKHDNLMHSVRNDSVGGQSGVLYIDKALESTTLTDTLSGCDERDSLPIDPSERPDVYEFRDTLSAKGIGVYATRNIARGERIMEESPLVIDRTVSNTDRLPRQS